MGLRREKLSECWGDVGSWCSACCDEGAFVKRKCGCKSETGVRFFLELSIFAFACRARRDGGGEGRRGLRRRGGGVEVGV